MDGMGWDGAKLRRWCRITSYLCKDGRKQRDARADLLVLLLAVPSPDLTGPGHILLGHRHGLGSWAETSLHPRSSNQSTRRRALGDKMDKAPPSRGFPSHPDQSPARASQLRAHVPPGVSVCPFAKTGEQWQEKGGSGTEIAFAALSVGSVASKTKQLDRPSQVNA